MFKNILKQKLLLIASFVLLVLFVGLMILLKNVDVKEIGLSNTAVGLATVNERFFNSIGVSDTFDKITDILLVLSFGVVGFMAFLGLYRLIKYKKLDLTLVVLGVFYTIMFALYVIFDTIHFNYSPILETGEPKESFVSSHVLCALFVFLSSIIIININITNNKLKLCSVIVMALLSILMVVFRLLSGRHWFTDIVGGELLALLLVLLFALVVATLKTRVIEFGKKDEKELH